MRLLSVCLPQTPSLEPFLRAERRKDTYQRPGLPGRHFAFNPHTDKWSVTAGREEGQIYTSSWLSSPDKISSKKRKCSEKERKKERWEEEGGGQKKKKKRVVFVEKQTKQQNEKKKQGLMKMLLPNPVRQVRSFATLNIQVQACFARRWGDLQYAGPGCK